MEEQKINTPGTSMEKILDTWHKCTDNAMQSVWERFNENSKCILTESDLKCWLFMSCNNSNLIAGMLCILK